MNKTVIGGIPLFAGIEHAELEGFLRIFQPVAFAAGACLMRQGQPADGAYVLEAGAADEIHDLGADVLEQQRLHLVEPCIAHSALVIHPFLHAPYWEGTASRYLS